ncbi:MAG TPA: hypothetical protein VNA30_05725 [Mycobacteriales bacterium]|nr:hypothetical protein [Mycobacteriales bacterium]
MAVESADDLVRDYLGRLEREAAVLPADRRADLVTGIGEHLAETRALAEGDEAAAVREALMRLGTPAHLVTADLEEIGAQRAPAPLAPGTGRELAAVLLLTGGSFVVPVAGWIAGVVLLWTSSLWTRGEKWLGTLVWPGGPFFVFLLPFALALPGGSCLEGGETTVSGGEVTVTSGVCHGSTSLLWLGVPLALLYLGAPIAVALLLYRRARRRANAAMAAPAPR